MGNKAKGKDIFVADISFDADEEELRKLFSVCGTVRSIHLLTDKRTGQFSGRAFVRMATTEEAKNAVQTLDGALLINRCIRVSLARDTAPAKAAAEAPQAQRQRHPQKRKSGPRR
jgi:RNA recognition motif-containing protein